MVVFYKIWKKYNGIQVIKNKTDLNKRKIKNHPPSQVTEVKETHTITLIDNAVLSGQYMHHTTITLMILSIKECKSQAYQEPIIFNQVELTSKILVFLF